MALKAIDALFSFRGRMKRSHYLLASLGLGVGRIVILILALAATPAKMDDETGMTLRGVLDVSFLWPSAAIVIKRGHDRNRPTAYSAVLIGAVYGAGVTFGYLMDAGLKSAGASCALAAMAGTIYMFIDYGLIDGTKGPNRYGPSPKGRAGVGAQLAEVFD